MRSAPYLFAARAVLAAAAIAVVGLAADRAIAWEFARGTRLVPPLPPSEPLPPREMFQLAAARGAVVVLGDSIVTYVPRDDSDSANLYTLIAREVPSGVAAVNASRGGRGIRMISAQMAVMKRFELLPRALVLVVNPRGFSPTCETNPFLQEGEKARIFETGSFLPVRAAAVFKYRFGTPSAEEYLETPVFFEGVRAGTVRDLERPRAYFPTDDGAPPGLARTRSLARYAFDMDRSLRLAGLRSAVAGICEKGVPVVAVLAPIDVEYLRKELSGTEMDAVERNIDALRKALAVSGVRCVDLTHAAAADQFDHPPLAPDEHLHAPSRHMVASRVGEALRAALAH